MLRIFSTHRLFAFLLTGLMITSCGGNTSSNTPTTGTSSGTSGGGTTSLADKAEMEWELYQSDCRLAGPIPAKTFSDGSRGRCVFDANSRPRAFRN